MAAKGLTADEMSNEFAEAKVTFRGTTYTLRELPMDQYDKTVKQATTKDEDGVETFDNAGHTKILTVKCLVSPKLSADELYGKGTRLVRALQGAALRLHLDPEPEEATPDDDEGEAPAPAKP